MVTLQSFRILAECQTAFISLSEHIDYSTPEGRLQLTILAAFAAYFSDMLAKHTSKGKGERAAQGLYNGDIPFGYRSTGPKMPPEPNKDMTKARKYPCPAGGYLQVRADLVIQQFGELLRGLRLPLHWRELIREQILEAAKKKGLDVDSIEREKEQLRLKRGRILILRRRLNSTNIAAS